MQATQQVIYDISNFPQAEKFINAVLSQQYDVIVYGGAIRGGKTFNGLGALVLLHKLFPGSRSAIVRDSVETLKRNTLPSCDKAFPANFIDKYNATDHTWTFTNGSYTFFFAENFDRDKDLKRWNGLEVNFVLLEQIEELQEATFEKALERVGSYFIPNADQPKPLIIVTVNPNDEWSRQMFYEAHLNGELPENWLYIPAKITDNPFVPESFYNSLQSLKRTNPVKYRRFVDGDWDAREKQGGEYYFNFDQSKHTGEVKFLPTLPTHLCFDFNVWPYMTLICYQLLQKKDTLQIRGYKEYCLAHPFNTTKEVCKAWANDYGDRSAGVFYYGDSSGKAKIPGLGDIHNYDLVEEQLLEYLNNDSDRVLRRNPNPLKRRDLVLEILAHELAVELILDEDMKETIKDFEHVKLGPNGKDKSKFKDKKLGISYELHGHPTDATEGFICWLLNDLL